MPLSFKVWYEAWTVTSFILMKDEQNSKWHQKQQTYWELIHYQRNRYFLTHFVYLLLSLLICQPGEFHVFVRSNRPLKK